MNIHAFISSGIIELYVLGLCSDEEKAEVEALTNQYSAVREAITNYEFTLENSLQKKGVAPPASIDEKVLLQISRLQIPVIELQPDDTKTKRLIWWKGLAAAAVILFLFSATLNFTLYHKLNRQTNTTAKLTTPATLPTTDYKVMMNPAITPVAMYGQGIHAICRCTLYWDKNTGKAYIMIHHLATSSSDKDYQLWAMVDGKPVSVGLIDESIRGRFIELSNVPDGANEFIVTLEKAGGNTEPTETQLYLKGTI